MQRSRISCETCTWRRISKVIHTLSTEMTMIENMQLRVLAFTLMLAVTPAAAVAQESMSDAENPAPASQATADLPADTEAETVAEALRPFPADAALLLAPSAASLATAPHAESIEQLSHEEPAALVMASKGSGTGLGFMIGGAAALVGGLLIGGTGGNIIAAGGVALGVYGAIVYF